MLTDTVNGSTACRSLNIRSRERFQPSRALTEDVHGGPPALLTCPS
jgi:hypothetical protein